MQSCERLLAQRWCLAMLAHLVGYYSVLASDGGALWHHRLHVSTSTEMCMLCIISVAFTVILRCKTRRACCNRCVRLLQQSRMQLAHRLSPADLHCATTKVWHHLQRAIRTCVIAVSNGLIAVGTLFKPAAYNWHSPLLISCIATGDVRTVEQLAVQQQEAAAH
jgi:hypothetical protein